MSDDVIGAGSDPGALNRIEEHELSTLYPVQGENGLGRSTQLEGVRVLHLQSHAGADSIALARRGATVVGIDASHEAVTQARALARELDLALSTRFIEADLYDARHILPEPDSFDLVYVTWGTIGWLPDLDAWARIVEWYLKPGGRLYFADVHPASGAEGSRQTIHSVEATVEAIETAGLTIASVREHTEAPWQLFDALVPFPGDMWGRDGDATGSPLALSIIAEKRA